MTLKLDLPDDIASKLAKLLPEGERDRFALSAISEALDARIHDSAECRAAVERALEDMDTGRNVIPFEDLCRAWDSEKLARQNAAGA